jgi:glyoxylase-like metal-dependent hydrolase (beta-lactamase superfamily II)
MIRERIAENIYWFQSEEYAQVTATLIAGPQWAVLVDTLAFPDESLEIRDFVEHSLGLKVRYIINTHYHADHAWGNCFFPGAIIIAHTLCRQLLQEKGIPSLAQMQEESRLYDRSKIVLPHITLSHGQISLQVGKKRLAILPAPGHSPDGLCALIEEERLLIAGDALMPVPHVVDGSIDDLLDFYRWMGSLQLENVVQGHGDIILRGEVEQVLEENMRYVEGVRNIARAALDEEDPLHFLLQQKIQDAGKSHILLTGLAEQIHQANLVAVYNRLARQPAPA